MKKTILIYSILLCSLMAIGQQISHDVSVVNIEVPVRVFKGDTFIDNLSIEDFEIYENNVIQKLDAIYLIKKTTIEKKKENKSFVPRVARNFVLLFEIQEYLPKAGDAIDLFFNEVILPGDSLKVVTPLKTYNFKPEALQKIPKTIIAQQLKEKLRQDTKMGNSDYRNVLRELENILTGDLDLDQKLTYFSQTLERLESLRYVDENKLVDFATFLKSLEGQKHVFMFYQKELVPQIDPRTINELMSMNQERQDILQNILDLFEFFRRDITFNVDKIKQLFADSSISIHFLFITKSSQSRLGITSMRPSGMRLVEKSEDIYGAFKEIAQATGGLTQNSANASSAFQRAVEASENYYLLYYTPTDLKKDGTFRKIEIKLKNYDYQIFHRAGYIAN